MNMIFFLLVCDKLILKWLFDVLWIILKFEFLKHFSHEELSSTWIIPKD